MNLTANDIIKIIVTATLCIALLGIGVLVYAGKADANVFVTFVLTTFAGIAGGAGAVTLTERGSKQGITTALNVMRAENKQ